MHAVYFEVHSCVILSFESNRTSCRNYSHPVEATPRVTRHRLAWVSFLQRACHNRGIFPLFSLVLREAVLVLRCVHVDPYMVTYVITSQNVRVKPILIILASYLLKPVVQQLVIQQFKMHQDRRQRLLLGHWKQPWIRFVNNPIQRCRW